MRHGGLQREREFPQGGGPWVSVMIPTRGRPDKLMRAVNSLNANAKRPDKVEYVFRVDEDDVATRTALIGVANVVVGPRGRGYLDLHEHIVAMANQARGDWLMNFNDDAIMLTEGWDRAFCGRMVTMMDDAQCWAGCPDGIFLLTPVVEDRPQSAEFFAVHRRAFEVLGHLGLNAGVDEWVDFVFKLIGRWARSPIIVRHENAHDQTFREGRQSLSGDDVWELTCSPRIVRQRVMDAMKLLDHIEGCNA